MSSNYYNKIFNEISYNTIITNVDESLATTLMDTGYFSNIQFTTDSLDVFNDIISGMNNIVYLIIISSSLLTIIVLYNLTTININERKREIATLKVLGFKDNEVSTYVYRETIILTSIGIIIGLFLGITLILTQSKMAFLLYILSSILICILKKNYKYIIYTFFEIL